MGVFRFALTTYHYVVDRDAKFFRRSAPALFSGMGKNRRSRQEGRQACRGTFRPARKCQSHRRNFPKRFPGIELDLTNTRGPSNAGRDRRRAPAGVRYFDLLISGTATPLSLLNAGILEPVEPLLLLPEVKDPNAGSAAISGSTTPSDLSTRFKSTSRKISLTRPS